MHTTNIAIWIIAKDEASVIPKTLESIAQVNYNKSLIHIFFADGNSSDGTREIFKENAEKYSLSHTIFNEAEHKSEHGYSYGHSHGRNIILNALEPNIYPYICRLDADCLVDTERLNNLITEIQKTDNSIAGWGGMRLVDISENIDKKELLLNYYITNRIVSLNNPAFTQTNQTYVRSIAWYNSIYKTEIIQKFRYETGFPFNTDDISINFFIKNAGYKLLYIPKAKIYHGMVNTIRSLFAMMVRYGKWSMFMTLKYRKILRFYSVVAVGYLIHLITLPLYLSHTTLISLRFFPTLVLVILWAIVGVQIKQKDKRLSTISCLILPIIQVVWYGRGSIIMMFKYNKVKKK
jgi:GT2 family glycosyltransferase